MISEHAMLGYIAQATARGWALMTSGSLLDGWHLVYRSRLDDFHVFLDVDEEWVYLQCPLLSIPPHPGSVSALYPYLLRANDRMFFAKLTLVRDPADGRNEIIALTSEAPVESFDAGLFHLMTDAIVRYAEDYGREVRSIALDPQIAALAGGVETEPDDLSLEIILEKP